MSVKLFDLRKKDYPKNVEFRTLQVHTCQICNSRTNLAISTGFPGTYLSAPCPNVLKDWHGIVAELQSAMSKIGNMSYVNNLLATGLAKVLDTHRNEIVDNIVGKADRSLTW